MRLRAGVLLLSSALLFARSALADGPLPANRGDPIQTSDYSVDLFQGPVLASARVTALAGAYTAIAEGAEGIPFNPAAASVRMPYSTTNVDWDIAGGLTLPTSISGTDFDNNGDSTFQKQENFFFGTAGGYIQYGHLAIGAMVSLQSYGLAQNPILRIAQPVDATGAPSPDLATSQVDVRFFKIDPVVSYGFLDDQLHVGAGLRAVYFQVAGNLGKVNPDGSVGDGSATDLYTNQAIGAQGGILWAPYAYPIRIGGAVRSPLIATKGNFGGGFKADEKGDIRAGNFYFPTRAELPWEVEGGFAIQLWKRPLNIKWRDEDEVPVAETERWRRTKPDGQIEPPYKGARRKIKQWYREIPRQKVLLTTSVLVSGPVQNAVGVESMLTGKLQRSGESTSLTVRGGVEAEVIPWWLILRGGSYLEPSRFSFSSSRLHGTAGFQVRLFRWDVFGLLDDDPIWRLSTVVDVSRGYFSWGAGIGTFL